MADVYCRIDVSRIPSEFRDRFEPPAALQRYATDVAITVRGDMDEGGRFDAHKRLNHAAFHIRSANLAIELLDGVTSDQGSERYGEWPRHSRTLTNLLCSASRVWQSRAWCRR